VQDRYAGDIGDYVKLGLLHALRGKRRLSVAWFRTLDQGPPGDGRHVAYLADPTRWRDLDPELFDQLNAMVAEDRRSIKELQPILAPPVYLREQTGGEIAGPSVTFHDELLSDAVSRTVWFVGLNQFAFRSDILFLDPDNGLTTSTAASPKHVAVDEVSLLRRSARTIIIYHHLGRQAGGHVDQMRTWAGRLLPRYEHRAICAVRSRSWSSRAFFIVGPDQQMWDRARAFAAQWPGTDFHDYSERPDDLGLTPGADAYIRADAIEQSRIYDNQGPFRL
jgi:hypothetical protein